MAGGLWTGQNKKLAGVYINVKSKPSYSPSLGNRGAVALVKALDWGEDIIEYKVSDDTLDQFGFDITHEKMLWLREMIKGSDNTSAPTRVIVINAKTNGAKATATVGNLTATAQNTGARGNDIKLLIEANTSASTFDVSVIVDGTVRAKQTAKTVEELVSNSWVKFSGTGAITATAGVSLAGGKTPTRTAEDFTQAFNTLEQYHFDVFCYDDTNETVAKAIESFITRMNETQGMKCQGVIAGDSSKISNKYIIKVLNGVVLNSGKTLTPGEATYWVAGASAGAQYNDSLTYAKYPGAITASPLLTLSEQEKAVDSGLFAFINNFSAVKVLLDVNSKIDVTADEGKEFKKNRVMRVLSTLQNDIYECFSNYFIGKVDNSPEGRDLLKARVIGMLNDMQSGNGIKNFSSEDVEVFAGESTDSILINIALQPMDSIEKIYIAVTVSATEG